MTGGESFEAAYARRRDHLLRVAWLVCGDLDQAEDVVAAAMARCWRAWDRRGPVAEPDAYLRRAVVNEATDRFRRRGRDRAAHARRFGDARGAPALADAVADRTALVVALGALPVGQRAVVVLRYFADQTEVAMAEALGISVGTVKSRTSRALIALRHALGEGPAVSRREDEDAKEETGA